VSTRLSRSALAFALGCVISVAEAQDARIWLDKMNQAVENLNYVGTFVHMQGGNAETMRVIHRNDGGQIGERLVSLDGIGREIIRQEDKVQCILPDRKMILREETKAASPLISSLPSYSEQLEANYTLKLYSTRRTANRQTQLVGITPKDEYRYGYLLWLDQATGMPLKSKLVGKRIGEKREIIEEILFTSIEFPESIPQSALAPTTDTKGFTLFAADSSEDQAPGSVPWHARELPQGFNLTRSMRRPMAGCDTAVDHLVFSDGLATVSVFVEAPHCAADVAEGFSTVGSTNAFSLTSDGRRVTAVGEVPETTVERIANSLEAH